MKAVFVNKIDSAKCDEEAIMKISLSYRLEEPFHEIVDYLDNDETELFLFNVIGRESLYPNAALKEL